MASDRFIDGALSKLQDANRSPIFGFQHYPLVSLEIAVKNIIPLVPELTTYLPLAKKHCNRRHSSLTFDESAAIYLYTMPTTFFSRLNERLRDKNRDVLKPWFSFLRLFIHALEKIPSKPQIVWRGVQGDVGNSFVENARHTWWSVNSCSSGLNVIEVYLGDTGTVFAINASAAKDISEFSAFPEEREVILMPGTEMLVKSTRLSFKNSLFIVHLDENNNGYPTGRTSEVSSLSIPLKASIDLRCVTQRPFKARSLPSAVKYGMSASIAANTQFILLFGHRNLHLFNEELELVRSTKSSGLSSEDLVDMIWCESVHKFIILTKKSFYVFDPAIAQLSLIESIRLSPKDEDFTCCTCSSSNLFIGVCRSSDKSCLYQYTLPSLRFVSRSFVADFLGVKPPPQESTSYWAKQEKISRDDDDRKILTLRYNCGRLGILVEYKNDCYLYSLDLTKQPLQNSITAVPYKEPRLVVVDKSGEWLIIKDAYDSKIIQIALDCQLKSECESKEYSKSSFFSFSTGFINLQGTVKNATMFGTSALVLLLRDSLALYQV